MTTTIQHQILIKLDQIAHKVNQFAQDTKKTFDALNITYGKEVPTVESIKSIAYNLIQTVRDQVLDEINWKGHNYFYAECGRIQCIVYKHSNGEFDVELFVKLNQTSWY